MSKGGSGKQMPLSVCVPATATSGRDLDDASGLSAPDPSLVVETVDVPAVGCVETVQLSSPPMSRQLSPGSPRTVAFEDLWDSSVPLPPIVFRRGDHRTFRRMAVCFMCRQFRQDF